MIAEQKPSDIRAKTPDELDTLLLDLRKEQFNLRFRRAVEGQPSGSRIREVRREHGLPSPDQVPIGELEFELVWALHASIFYIGIRKWIYGLAIPDDVEAIVTSLATAFLEGVPGVMKSLTARARPSGTSRRSRRRA